MIVCCLCAVWSSGLGLTRCSLGESCAGGDDEGDWGECTQWDEEDVDVGLVDILFVMSLFGIHSKIIGSLQNVTLFLCFRLGSWKESTLSCLVRICLLAFGGSWNDDPSWHSGFKWAQFLLYFLPLGPSIKYEHPRFKISTTVPVNHFSLAPNCFCRKNRTCSFTLRTLSPLAQWAQSKCSFCICWISSSRRRIFWMLMGLWRRGMTAPCAGHPCKISTGDGKSFAIGVLHNCSRALAWAFRDPSIFLYAALTFLTIASMNPFNWWKCGEDVWCLKSNSLVKHQNSSPLRGGPLLVMTMAGMPLVKNRSLRYLSIFWWCVDATGKMNGNLEK